MSSIEKIKNTFMTSIYPPSLFQPSTKSFSKLAEICSQRLKLYYLLQNAAYDRDLYSEQWTLHLVEALAKEGLEHFLALLDSKRTSELLVNLLADCMAASCTTEAVPECEAGGLTAKSNSASECKAREPIALECKAREPCAPECKAKEPIALECKAREHIAPECKAREPIAPECKARESSAPEYKAREPLTDSLLEDYFMDDALGHFFIGLMAGLSQKDKLTWLFADLEMQWFHLKFILNVPEESMIDFLAYNNFVQPEKASKEEILSMTDLLSIYDLDFELDIPPVIFKLPFDAAPKLIAKREVAIKDGILYFPNKREYIRVLIHHHLKDHWKTRVDMHSERWLSARNVDERYQLMLFDDFIPLLKNLLQHIGGTNDGNLTVQNINEHANNVFPLCMAQMHHLLKERSHLQHFARTQYAIFLKHAGMPFEHAMAYFEGEFTNKITSEEFRKQRHEYYFSHCYGEVGSKIDYSEQSCEDIINVVIPTGRQEHGCPFAHSDENKLIDMLIIQGITPSSIKEILNSRKEKRYREACCLYFSDKIGQPLASVTSPNEYYACALDLIVDIEDILK